uniref:Coiled-coil-helix-coiled-coil-helix domain-containing protein 7 n=1 Tax=Ixodes ricinus TaxID=34613 RepID=A0A0K8RNV5_IXORI
MSPTDAGKSLTRAEKATSQDLNNPCLKEQRLSLKCLDDNGYDKKKCESFFVNYNVCQKFWLSITKERKALGIEPALPPPEEREGIKRDRLRKAPKKLMPSPQSSAVLL